MFLFVFIAEFLLLLAKGMDYFDLSPIFSGYHYLILIENFLMSGYFIIRAMISAAYINEETTR